MSDSFEFTLHSPLTKEDWNKISDAELEKTMSITFQTPQGRQVKYIKCDVLDKIRAEIEGLAKPNEFGGRGNGKSVRYGLCKALEIIDKYIAEGSGEE